MTGQRISHYEILEKIGTGGMGEVWKARDLVLNRLVAMKFLRAGDVPDPKRRARMIEEARAAGSLNHTNIAALYDIVQEDERDILVMEFVEGRPLDEVIGGKPLKTRVAIEYAIQMADALAAAHRTNLAHRDLKPSNLIVTPQNTLKILDFGLAKRTGNAAAASAGMTQTVALTEHGQVVGTPAYMSPEQAEGLPVDPRTDIFSFGAVLYEMLSGRMAFGRESRVATLNAVVHEDPPPVEILSRPLQRLVNACLQKEPAKRIQSMSDVRLFLEAAQETTTTITSSSELAPVPVPARRLPLAMIAGVAAAALVLGALGAWLLTGRTAKHPGFAPVRVTIDGRSHDPSISPDGKLVAFASDRAAHGNQDIWVQDVESGSAIRLTSEASQENRPVFSADGQQIYFLSNRKPSGIYSMSRLGGEAKLVVPEVPFVEPSPDGKWLAYVLNGKDLYVKPVGGGEPKKVYTAAGSLTPQLRWYVDSRTLLLNAFNTNAADSYGLLDIATGKVTRTRLREQLAERGFTSNNSAIGWLDADTFVLTILHHGVRRAISFSWSPKHPDEAGPIQFVTLSNQTDYSGRLNGGRIVFDSGNEKTPLWAFPGDVNQAQPSGPPGSFADSSEIAVHQSIDGNHTVLAYTIETTRFDQVLIDDLATRKRRVVAPMSWNQYYNILNRDGTRLIFGLTIAGGEIYRATLAGGEPVLLCDGCGPPRAWTADERFVVYSDTFNGQAVLSVLDTSTKARARVFEPPSYGIRVARLSRDDRYVAMAVSRGTVFRLFIAPFRGAAPVPASEWVEVPVPHSTITNIFWSPNGRWIYYIAGELEDPDATVLGAMPWDPETRKVSGQEKVFFRFGADLQPYTAISNAPAAAPDRVFIVMNQTKHDIWLLDPRTK